MEVVKKAMTPKTVVTTRGSKVPDFGLFNEYGAFNILNDFDAGTNDTAEQEDRRT